MKLVQITAVGPKTAKGNYSAYTLTGERYHINGNIIPEPTQGFGVAVTRSLTDGDGNPFERDEITCLFPTKELAIAAFNSESLLHVEATLDLNRQKVALAKGVLSDEDLRILEGAFS